jgi:hypothetical protein
VVLEIESPVIVRPWATYRRRADQAAELQIDPVVAWEADRARATSPTAQARDRESELDPALVRDREREQARSREIVRAADARRTVMCRTSLDYPAREVETMAAADLQTHSEMQQPVSAVLWPAARPLSSCRTDRAMHCRGRVASPALVTSRAHCRRDQGAAKD